LVEFVDPASPRFAGCLPLASTGLLVFLRPDLGQPGTGLGRVAWNVIAELHQKRPLSVVGDRVQRPLDVAGLENGVCLPVDGGLTMRAV
jgi:hypothetical protein